MIKKICLNKSKFSSEFSLLKHVQKQFLRISVLVSEIVTFLTKKIISLWISSKMLQNYKRNSLAVCGSIWGEKRFLLYLSHFTGLIKNSCLNKSKFSSGFVPFKHGEKNKLSGFFGAHFWDSHFYVLKEKFSMNIHQNASKKKRYSRALCGSLFGEKQFLII